MLSKKLKIFSVFDKTSLFSNRKVAIDTSKVNDVLSRLYSPGESYQLIFDFGVRKFRYVSPSVFDFFGEKAEDFTVDKFLERLHPDDMEHFVNCEKIAAHFLFKHIPKNEIPDYKVSYQIRMRDVNGTYKLILHQAIAVVMDAEMNISATLLNHSDISHISNDNNYSISFINVSGNKSYYNIKSIDDLNIRTKVYNDVLTKRELEILGYLSEGLSSKEIAESLFISTGTVRTHRNNILKKTNFKTMSQAVAHYVRQGLI